MMTKQEMFDPVFLGLKAQGFERSTNDSGGCMYRGLGGRKCAAGHVIPDAEYSPDMEENRILAIIDGTARLPEGVEIKSLSSLKYDRMAQQQLSREVLGLRVLLSDLQGIHDLNPIPADMEKQLRDYAQSAGLTVPE